MGEDYTVGQHSYNIAILLFVLHPEPTLALYTAIMLHDSHELYTGDIPAPVKHLNCGLHERFLDLAELIEVKVGIDKPLTLLTHEERQWLRALDQIEFFLFCQDQVHGFGNQHLARSLQYVEEWFKTNFSEMPESCQEFVTNFQWRKTDERL